MEKAENELKVGGLHYGGDYVLHWGVAGGWVGVGCRESSENFPEIFGNRGGYRGTGNFNKSIVTSIKLHDAYVQL